MAQLKKAGIFDPAQPTLPPVLWDKDSLRPEIKEYILNRIQYITKLQLQDFNSILLIGSMLGYQYNEGSDIDVTVTLKPEFDSQMLEIKTRSKSENGKFLPGTKHPVNVFVLPSFKSLRPESMYAGYDLIHDAWVKKTAPPTDRDLHRFDMSMPYLKLRKNELKRQIRQLACNPNKDQESVEVAKEFARLDRDRKWAYKHPGQQGGQKSTQNAAFKYSLRGMDEESIEDLFRILRAKGLTFKE